MIRTGFLSIKQAQQWAEAQVRERWPSLEVDESSFALNLDGLKAKPREYSEDDVKFDLVDMKVAPYFGIVSGYINKVGDVSYAVAVWVPEFDSELIAGAMKSGQKKRAA